MKKNFFFLNSRKPIYPIDFILNQETIFLIQKYFSNSKSGFHVTIIFFSAEITKNIFTISLNNNILSLVFIENIKFIRFYLLNRQIIPVEKHENEEKLQE